MALLKFSLTRPFNISFRGLFFDLVLGNTYFVIERSGLPFKHRDFWNDESGGLNAYLFGLYFSVANNRPRGNPAPAQA